VDAEAVAGEIVRCCQTLRQAGLIAGVDGNLSVRLSHDRVLITPSGLPKAELRPDDLVEVDLAGTHRRGYREASSELDLHIRAYRQRSDCSAVVHAHPPAATAFAVAGEGLPGDVLPEIVLLMGQVPCIPHQTTGTPALGDAAEPYLGRHCAILLANHGALTWGENLTQARIRMESLEHAARILLAARALGRVNRLSQEQIAALERMRGRSSHGQNHGH
jgi:L-fuculose-phosphate aldolase